jgi:hypothetical protein
VSRVKPSKMLFVLKNRRPAFYVARSAVASVMRVLLASVVLLVVACTPETDETPLEEPGLNDCRNANTDGATPRCLAPTLDADYYVDQALKYFDTLDIDADRDRVPDYAPDVARWEWPPWLLLTGLGAEDMISTAGTLRNEDPSTVPVRDCRFFDKQPFARCYVEFVYEEGPCPIYEEFTFNEAGQTTFIEAWSNLPALLPQGEADAWAEASDYPRLATRIPGLGTPKGALDIRSQWMREAADNDPDVADFAERATDWWGYWYDALEKSDPDFFAQGCGWD